MRMRLRFEKTGPVRFVGHLDFMRSFQKIIKLSGLPAVYTSGFNPHMILSFADPLGVGQESTAEYADVDFAFRDPGELSVQERDRLKDLGLDNDALPPAPPADELLRLLNEAAPGGVRFTAAGRMGLIKNSKAMAQVRYASWIIALRDDLLTGADLSSLAERVMAQPEVVVRKVTKKAEKEVDIRPLLVSLQAAPPEAFPPFIEGDGYRGKRALLLTCATGSFENLKPAVLMEALCRLAGEPFDPLQLRLVRTELYDAERRPLLKEPRTPQGKR